MTLDEKLKEFEVLSEGIAPSFEGNNLAFGVSKKLAECLAMLRKAIEQRDAWINEFCNVDNSSKEIQDFVDSANAALMRTGGGG